MIGVPRSVLIIAEGFWYFSNLALVALLYAIGIADSYLGGFIFVIGAFFAVYLRFTIIEKLTGRKFNY